MKPKLDMKPKDYENIWVKNNDPYEVLKSQRVEDYIRIEAKFLYNYVTVQNQYNLKVVKELLEGMLQEVNNRLNLINITEELKKWQVKNY